MITADNIVDDIAKGVREALRTSEFLLGAEAREFQHPEIHPEYLVTIEVAKKMGRMDRVVALETHMDDLRNNAKRKAISVKMLKSSKYSKAKEERESISALRDAEIAKINQIVSGSTYQFSAAGKGKKRVDIVVFTSDTKDPPVLIAEAKLGSQTPDAIIADIDRVITLLQMYRDLGLDHNIYGAVFFYRMLKGGSILGVQGNARNLLERISSHLSNKKADVKYSWLKSKADLLSRESYVEPIQAYEELYDDGSTETVFARRGFAFAPGLVLLGRSDDVETVSF
ncbi:hypothetical protein [Methylobacterium sp. Leaf469]|uniref:hypothetical protein n=1 Tax=Methylobacterium sp. Leaf469 TaxID=1736387 RepID=UPI000ADCE062|nr:hypothetical protein [Methylobacterium sp. Leaf469]